MAPLDTRRNVVILTSGLSGSSVLAGLIARAGYWTGDSTHKKNKEYDTFENAELISLNRQLFNQAAYVGNYTMEFSAEPFALFAALHGKIDVQPYRDFLARCDAHQPWLWKDPRLWLTIYFWKNLLPLQECRFVLITRSYYNCWVSQTLRRQIRSYGSLKRYEQSIKNSLSGFLAANGLHYLHLTYENLIGKPEQTIQELNAFIGSSLTIQDLAAVYHKPLHKPPNSSLGDLAKAVAIYLKNYSERVDLVEKKKPA
jgi:hypothetical protein